LPGLIAPPGLEPGLSWSRVRRPGRLFRQLVGKRPLSEHRCPLFCP